MKMKHDFSNIFHHESLLWKHKKLSKQSTLDSCAVDILKSRSQTFDKSGKTSLAKRISQIASTASFDKNPQSQERGITIDLGFSSLKCPIPDHLKGQNSKLKHLQFTFVDCPGHASLLRTVIGGAQIIDMIILVLDICKGIQTQTAECLVLGEVTCRRMVVVLNKIDMIPEEKRTSTIQKVSKKMQLTLKDSVFKDSPIVSLAANPGGSDNSTQIPVGIDNLIEVLKRHAVIPERSPLKPFLFAVDHCFGIRGQGTVLTGTVLQGSVSVGDVIEIPSLKLEKKVKSMQMFRQNVTSALQGDRLGICFKQLDSNHLERGIICAPSYSSTLHAAIIPLNVIKYFKSNLRSNSKFHISIGYETVIGRITIFRVCDTQYNNDGNLKDIVKSQGNMCSSKSEVCTTQDNSKVIQGNSKDNVCNTQDSIGNSKDNVCDTQDNVGNSKDNVSNTQDSIGNSKDNVCNTQDSIGNSKDNVCDTQDSVGNSKDNVCNTQDNVGNSKDNVCNTQDNAGNSNDAFNTQRNVSNSQNLVKNSEESVANSQHSVANSQHTVCNTQGSVHDSKEIDVNLQHSVADSQNRICDTQGSVSDLQNNVGSNSRDIISHLQNIVGDSRDGISKSETLGNSKDSISNPQNIVDSKDSISNHQTLGSSEDSISKQQTLGNLNGSSISHPQTLGSSEDSISKPQSLGNLNDSSISNPQTLGNLNDGSISNPQTLGDSENSISIPQSLGNLNDSSISNPQTPGDSENSISNPQEVVFDMEKEYLYVKEYCHVVDKNNPDMNRDETKLQHFVLIEFETPVLTTPNSLVIGSRLDMDMHKNNCRLAFWGGLIRGFTSKNYPQTDLPSLKVFSLKSKVGTVDRVVDRYTVIGRNIFKKETNLGLFVGLEVRFSTGEVGRIEGGFGLSGKVKICVRGGLKEETVSRVEGKKKKGKGDLKEGMNLEPVRFTLCFKKFKYDACKKITQ